MLKQCESGGAKAAVIVIMVIWSLTTTVGIRKHDERINQTSVEHVDMFNMMKQRESRGTKAAVIVIVVIWALATPPRIRTAGDGAIAR